ncbi:CcoQ/FixQ family Cbb3-type cytochrome c oxidase assembly chaperone [Shewanella amazonensis]|uniref:Cytochrome c oxidase, cbb3-type, CcoQ subunit n=1 Tax=Shewanella amazonensis (strain ATCC BAA-1098 / SB2B) TaxID=326297 RepID=A1S6J2_SHEAM|nr:MULTISPECIES: CcoQ/FixQ family Cbb3-type cytochrome c oxidase assembly chaperone [Shewanella]ABL99998.1 cytochrome c oxidase, cbb3-type, CcoQ subunit [Shewanella amazonensis SB2B]QYJ77102.1 CcoQ/FixQ family Cbb3-type cytochrome c oxidase assembly chaperone [Shewanella sp. FJAT-52076]QYK03462.1 CcoQ/FixQ family Cbb3-type cytochrome c oxidase assembly chaperone [Shewanella zhangzhouensis]
MDYGTLHGIVTIVVMLTFVGIFAWAYSSRRKKSFDEAANLVFSDEETKAMKDSGEQK